MSENAKDFDFMALGQAIKKARESKGITREQLAEQLDIVPRHLQSVENEGQYPSFQLFVRLITIFDISADQYIFSDKQATKTTLRRQVDTILDTFEDKDLTVIEGTAKGICKAKEGIIFQFCILSYPITGFVATIRTQNPFNLLQSIYPPNYCDCLLFTYRDVILDISLPIFIGNK